MRDERHDDAFDELIGSAAKAMTAGEPTGALRNGVRARIGRRSSAWLPLPAWGFAAATVVAAVFVGWNVTKPADDGTPGRSAPGIVTAVPSRVPAPVASPPAVAQTTASRAPGRRLAAAVPPPLEEEDPLIPPITIEPLSTTRIAVDASSGVMPIEIEPLQIEPLQLSGQ